MIPKAGEDMIWERVSGGAAACCRTLWQAGFDAFPVGGCVRDLLLGKRPGDWDVTTSAMPEQVMVLFDRVAPTGIKHGTVTVLLEDEAIEVTTFRSEAGYSDGRRPDAVCFGVALEEDLARRDFTINAMALDRDGSVIDLFGGQNDLERRIIRCVGQPERRFTEDALRMFRAVRFSARFGFELSQETVEAIRACAPRAACLAAERVRVELEKILCSPRAEDVNLLFELGLMTRWAQGTPRRTNTLSKLPCESAARWAGLCGLLLEGGNIDCAERLLTGLRSERRLVQACRAGERLWRSGLPGGEADWRRALARYGMEGCRAGGAMGVVCGYEDALAGLERVLAQSPCVSVTGLALSGGELAQMGLRGPRIGAVQRRLLVHVLEHPRDNRPDVLRRMAAEFL